MKNSNTVVSKIKLARKIFEQFTDVSITEYTSLVELFRTLYTEFDHGLSKPLNKVSDMDLYKAVELLQCAMTATNTDLSDFDSFDFTEALNICLNGGEDFSLDLPCGEVRIINDSEIEDIWHEGLIEQIKECYNLDEVPNFIEIDWDATAENCKVDGKGHHFAGYDHEEHTINDWFVFRTN